MIKQKYKHGNYIMFLMHKSPFLKMRNHGYTLSLPDSFLVGIRQFKKKSRNT